MTSPDPVGDGSDQRSDRPGPPYRISSDRRVWLILGIVAMLLSCCCVGATVIAVTLGDDIYRLMGS